MIKAEISLSNPDAVYATVSLTMTVGEFRKLADQLKDAEYWPCGKTAELLRDVIYKAHNSFSAREEKL